MSKPDHKARAPDMEDRAAKRPKICPEEEKAEEEDTTQPDAHHQKTSEEEDIAQPDASCCPICEAELGKDDNNGEGYTCCSCWGDGCETNQVCADCMYERGFICATCNQCHNHDCSDGTESGQFICEECLEIYCKECGNPKSGKNGVKLCISCQPWWQKNKPAECFCKDCGSQRSDANLCTECGERVCFQCPSLTCEECEDPEFFRCEFCGPSPEVTYCEDCGINLCGDCKCSCAEEKKREENAEE